MKKFSKILIFLALGGTNLIDRIFLDDFMKKHPEFKDSSRDERALFYKAVTYIRENFNVSFTKIDNPISLTCTNSNLKIYDVRKNEKYLLYVTIKINTLSSTGNVQYQSFVYDPFSDSILNLNIKNLKLNDSEKLEITPEILNNAISRFLDSGSDLFGEYCKNVTDEAEQEKTKLKEYFENIVREFEEEEGKINSKISEISEKLNNNTDFKLFDRLYKERETLYSKLAAIKDKNGKRMAELDVKQQNILMKIDNNIKLKLEVCGLLVIKYEDQDLNVFIEDPGFSKFVTYNTLTGKHDLNCSCGKNMSEFIVTKKDELICEDCAIKCDECSGYLSRFDSYHTCNTCNKNLCEDCAKICYDCGNYFCNEHIYKCKICNKPICEKCLHTCAICGLEMCKEHTHRCSICDREICKSHSGICSICGREICTDDLIYCSLCGRRVCKDHARLDSLDNKYYCIDDVEECSYCGKYYSTKHIEHCSKCNIALCINDVKHCKTCNAPLCNEHTYHCEVCGKDLCENHVFRCDTCGKTLCEEHIEKCSICGKIECNEHINSCSICGEKVCAEHIHDGICDTCRNRREVKEDFIVFEILKKYNLSKRGKWSKSENRENIFYYNEYKELSVFKLVKNSGEIIRMQ